MTEPAPDYTKPLWKFIEKELSSLKKDSRKRGDRSDLIVTYFAKNENRVDINEQDGHRNGSTALHDAITFILPQVCVALMERGADLYLEDYEQMSARNLLLSHDKYLPVLKALYESGWFPVNKPAANGSTPLYCAAGSNKAEKILSYLLDGKGCEVDVVVYGNYTPLLLSVACNNLRATKVLCIEGNPDLTIRDAKGHTALELAVMHRTHAVKFLQEDYPRLKRGAFCSVSCGSNR